MHSNMYLLKKSNNCYCYLTCVVLVQNRELLSVIYVYGGALVTGSLLYVWELFYFPALRACKHVIQQSI